MGAILQAAGNLATDELLARLVKAYPLCEQADIIFDAIGSPAGWAQLARLPRPRWLGLWDADDGLLEGLSHATQLTRFHIQQ